MSVNSAGHKIVSGVRDAATSVGTAITSTADMGAHTVGNAISTNLNVAADLATLRPVKAYHDGVQGVRAEAAEIRQWTHTMFQSLFAD